CLMNITVHHQPLDTGLAWTLRAWQLAWNGNTVWDANGISKGELVDFQFPDVSDPRQLSFKYRSTSASSSQTTWEPDDFVRQVVQAMTAEIWTFAYSPRILYEDPAPPGIVFNVGDVLTFKVITQNQFRGGQIYAWNPYDPTNPRAYF